MHWPPPLRRGSHIALVAPARQIKPIDLKPFLEFCQVQEWKALYDPKNLFEGDGFFGGSDSYRAKVLQDFLDDDGIGAIWLVRGGHGVSRIWPRLDWGGFQRHPKWIIGFSDGTPLLWGAVYQGVVAIHGPVAVQVPKRLTQEALHRLLSLLRGEKPLPLLWKRQPGYVWKKGEASGHLLGGNLSLLATLAGTSLDYRQFQGKSLLFWEEVGEYVYRLDRLCWHLRNAQWLTKAQGLLVGGLSSLYDDEDLPFSRTPPEIIADITADYGGPVAMGLPAGHIRHNHPLPLGAQTRLVIEEEEAALYWIQ